jgi:hypothetical protein
MWIGTNDDDDDDDDDDDHNKGASNWDLNPSDKKLTQSTLGLLVGVHTTH